MLTRSISVGRILCCPLVVHVCAYPGTKVALHMMVSPFR